MDFRQPPLPSATAESFAIRRSRVGHRRNGERWRNRLLAAVLALLLLYTFALAKTLLVPVFLAVLLSLLLAPAVRRLCGWHVPRALASIAVVGGVLTVTAMLLVMISGPAQSFLAKAPEGLQRIEHQVREWRRPIEDMSRRASRSLERIAQLGDPAPADGRVIAMASPGLIARVMATMPTAVAGLVIVVFLTFLLLLYGEAILRKMASLMPRFRDRRRLVETTRHTQHQLSAYVITITLINVCLGLVVAGVLALMGVDEPLLWGGMAAILNFAPYVGATIGLLLLTLAGFAQFADPAQALLVPMVFLLIQTIEGQVVTPLVLGRSMALDPVVVFLSILLLGWLWGVIGMLIAVPLLTCLRICAERVRGWYPLARLLGPTIPLPPQRLRERMRSRETQRSRRRLPSTRLPATSVPIDG